MAAVVGFLVISFAIWGIGDIFRGFGRSTVAKIGRTEITIEQFRSLYNDRMQQYSRQFGRPITPEQARTFRDTLEQTGLRQVMAHDSYLINLASPDPDLYRRSLDAFVEEMGRAGSILIARVATLWPGGMRPATVTFSSINCVPPTSCERAMTTSSPGCSRMVRDARVSMTPPMFE